MSLTQQISTRIQQLDPLQQVAYVARLKWLASAKPYQVMPPIQQDWTVWMMLAGRGAGKTRSAAEALWWLCWTEPNTRALVLAPTSSDIKHTCFEGQSGLMSVIPEALIEDYNKSEHIIKLKNGSQIRGISADTPERLRGPQFHFAWCDELAAYQYLQEAWDMMMFGLRLGDAPRVIVTTTPKSKDLIVQLIERDDCIVDRASTYQNLDNLAPTFRQQILQYDGTRLGRQEIYGELIDAEESGVVQRSQIKLWPHAKPFPEDLMYVVQSYDCAFSDKDKDKADFSACTTWGVFKPTDGPVSVLLLDCWQEKLSFPELKAKVLDEYTVSYGEGKKQKRPDLVLIEEKAAGISLIQELRRAHLPVIGWNPGRADKMQRLQIAATVFVAGRVWMPESGMNRGFVRDWAEPLVSQLCAYPECSHDDLMDSCTQALRYLKDSGWLEINPPPREDDYDDLIDYMPPKVNPYAA